MIRRPPRSTQSRSSAASDVYKRQIDRADGGYQVFDIAFIQHVLVDHHPASLFGLLVEVQFACQVPQVLTSMIEIDNLNGPRKMEIGDVPDPFGSVADHDLKC